MANPVYSVPKWPICTQETTLSDGQTVIFHLAEGGKKRLLSEQRNYAEGSPERLAEQSTETDIVVKAISEVLAVAKTHGCANKPIG